jgi:hypothetical protein
VVRPLLLYFITYAADNSKLLLILRI